MVIRKKMEKKYANRVENIKFQRYMAKIMVLFVPPPLFSLPMPCIFISSFRNLLELVISRSGVVVNWIKCFISSETRLNPSLAWTGGDFFYASKSK